MGDIPKRPISHAVIHGQIYTRIQNPLKCSGCLWSQWYRFEAQSIDMEHNCYLTHKPILNDTKIGRITKESSLVYKFGYISHLLFSLTNLSIFTFVSCCSLWKKMGEEKIKSWPLIVLSGSIPLDLVIDGIIQITIDTYSMENNTNRCKMWRENYFF